MASTQPARGMRDFLPREVRKRDYVIGIIKQVYESYGFEPLETPAVENIDTLMGKYGEEGNQLIFKILKRGEKLVQSASFSLSERDDSIPLNELADLALRYDLTVPLARVVANNRNELPKFFKRYQIQPVWRADRPARGRFREFYQCDVDAIGSKSMTVEADLLSAISEIFLRLGFKDFVIRLNSRLLLDGIMFVSQIPAEKRVAAITIFDKLDKIGVDGVTKELLDLGITERSVETLLYWTTREHYFALDGKLESHVPSNDAVEANKDKLDLIYRGFKDFSSENQGKRLGTKAIDGLRHIISLTENTAARNHIKIDASLARGLSYYTGTIMEINVPDLAGSLGGGGRYDGLIGMFGKEQIPACGFSLGLERILVVMDERGMFPAEIAESAPADVLVTIRSDETAAESLKLAQELRSSGLRVTLYPEPDKLGKQIKYADSIKVPFVAVLGESEIANATVAIKNMKTGDQQTAPRSEAGSLIA